MPLLSKARDMCIGLVCRRPDTHLLASRGGGCTGPLRGAPNGGGFPRRPGGGAFLQWRELLGAGAAGAGGLAGR